MRIFVSTEHSEDSLPKALIARASREGWSLDQSPTSPEDPRWSDWYSTGCARAIASADVVVSVVTPGWGASTWMCHEAEVALCTPRPLLLWNPAGRRVPAGMSRYAERPLPSGLEEAIAVLSGVRLCPGAAEAAENCSEPTAAPLLMAITEAG